MQFVNNYFISLPLIALLIALFLMVSVRRYRTQPIATTFLVLMSALAWWSLAVVLEHASSGLPAKILWVKMSYFGIVTLPPAWVVFMLQYANKEKWLTRRNLAMLTIMPVITIVMVWTNDIFHLMWKDIWMDTSLSPPVDAVRHNIGFWVQAVYAYLLLLLGTLFLLGVFLRSSGIYRKQAGTMLLATVVPWVCNFLFITGVGPFRVVDPTPLAFTITGIAFWWGLSHFHILDIMPIAHEAIFRNMTDGVIVVDEQSRITVINPAAEQILGFKRADTVGRPYSHILPGQADLTELKPDISHTPSVISTGEGQTRRYYAAYISPVNVKNHFGGHLVLLHDDTERRKAEVESRERVRLETEIVERKRAEEKIRESEAWYRNLVENTDDLIQSIAPDGRFIFVNKAWLETLGYTEAELPAMNLFNIIPPVSLPHCQEVFSRVMAGESVRDIDATFVTKDGRSVRVEGSVTPRIIEGRVVATQGVFHDITERKHAEELFETLTNDSPVGVYIVQDKKFCYVNPSFRSFTGYAKDELLGKDSLDLVIAEDRNIVRENVVNMLKGKLFSPHYFRVTDKNGGTRWVMESVTSIQYHGRRATLGSYMDITEHRQVEEALNLQKAYFEQLFDNSPDAIVMLDTGDRVVQVNKGFETLFGYSNPEIKGQLINELIIPEDRVKEALALSQVALNGEAVRTETMRRRKDGSLVDVSLLGYPIRFNDKLTGVYAIYSDITERKQAEDLYSTLAKSSPAGIYIYQDDKYRFVNPQFQKLTGYSEDKLLNISPWEFVYPEDRERARQSALQMLKRIRSSPYEFRVIGPNGQIRWAMETVTSINYNGKRATLGYFMDITERKQAEEALRESEEKLRLMFEALPQGITVIDMDGKIVQSNQATARIYGYDEKEEMIGLSIFEFVVKEDHGRVLEIMKKTLKEGPLGAFELTQLRKDRSEFPAEVSGTVLKDASDNPIGFITITEDITERKRMQEQLMLTDRLASIGELASGVAHELNNPLTSVIGFSQLLMEKDIADDMKEDLGLVNSEAQRCAGIVKNLLTFARKHVPMKQLSQVNNIIEDVLKLRAYEQKVNNIEIERRLARDLPEIMVDYFQMQQVFLNIIINAEYFMAQAYNRGRLTITSEKLDGIIRVSFADDGPGIPKENLRRLFTPFFTTKEVGKGTGLGLSICHGIVAEHGGKIYARSRPGEGATFVVELPVNTS